MKTEATARPAQAPDFYAVTIDGTLHLFGSKCEAEQAAAQHRTTMRPAMCEQIVANLTRDALNRKAAQ